MSMGKKYSFEHEAKLFDSMYDPLTVETRINNPYSGFCDEDIAVRAVRSYLHALDTHRSILV